MTPQEIIQALGIPMDDPPPWDGEVREVRAMLYECPVRILEIYKGRVIAQMILHGGDGATFHTRIDCLGDIVQVY